MPANFPATRLLLAYALHDPASLLPHHTIPTLLSLPVPLGPSLAASVKRAGQPTPSVTIKALVLDKDNTVCPPNSTALHPAYLAKLEKIKESPEFKGNPNSILIVSNTAGSTPSEPHEAEAVELERELSIPVLRQHPGRKKPFCGSDVLAFFKEKGVTSNPAEIAIVGDRLATDILLAREMGAWSVWTKDGWRNPEMPGRDHRGFMARMEGRVERVLRGGLQYRAPLPKVVASEKV